MLSEHDISPNRRHIFLIDSPSSGFLLGKIKQSSANQSDSYISIKYMKNRGGQVVKPGDGKKQQNNLYIIIFNSIKYGWDLTNTNTK